MSKLLKIFAAFLLGSVIVACSGAGSSPDATAKAFVENSYAGKADEVLKLLHMREEQKPGESEMMSGKIKMMVAAKKEEADKKGGVKKISIESSEIDKTDPNRAVVRVHVEFKEGSDTESVRLIKVDNKWKIFL